MPQARQAIERAMDEQPARVAQDRESLQRILEEPNEALAKVRRHVRIIVEFGRIAGVAADLSWFLDQLVVQVARAIEINHVKVLQYRPKLGRAVRRRSPCYADLSFLRYLAQVALLRRTSGYSPIRPLLRPICDLGNSERAAYA
jgi:hypothetical protein